MTRDDAVRMASAAMLLAARAGTDDEALAAAAGAARIMERFALTDDDLSDDAPDAPPEIVDGYAAGAPVAAVIRGRSYRWSLLDALARRNGCYAWRAGDHFQIAGPRAGMETVRYLFAALLAECERWIAREAAGLGALYRNRYGDGFVARLRERMDAQSVSLGRELRAESASNPAALVRLEARGAALVASRASAASTMRARYGLRTAYTVLSGNAGARAAGYAAGGRASLGGGARLGSGVRGSLK